MAMVLARVRRTQPRRPTIRSSAPTSRPTCCDRRSARIYPGDLLAPVPPALRQRYRAARRRDPRAARSASCPSCARTVGFARLNLMDERYPFDRDVDVIFCRNVLIYFDKPTQAGVLAPALRLPARRAAICSRPFRIHDRHRPAAAAGRQHRLPAEPEATHDAQDRSASSIVDDSASVRQTLVAILERRSRHRGDGRRPPTPSSPPSRIQQEMPDVIILDIEMPRMDGITFLRKLMAQRPIPVVICSSLTEARLGDADAGAGGRRGRRHPQAARSTPPIISTRSASASATRSRRAAQARLGTMRAPARRRLGTAEEADRRRHPAAAARGRAMAKTDRDGRLHRRLDRRHRGAARGARGAAGRRARHRHRPAHAGEVHRRLRRAGSTGSAQIEVKEAEDGDPVLRGRVLIAPGDQPHAAASAAARATTSRSRTARWSRATGPRSTCCSARPRSAAGANALGIIMTGMGDDGARGLLRDAQGRRPHRRAGRGDLRRLRHAEGSHRKRRRRKNPPARTHRSRNHAVDTELVGFGATRVTRH